MAQQVSGSDLTLLDAIRTEVVPRPALMRWNAWQQWRAAEGLRPRKARDGIEVPNVQEVALWKSVMEALHGPGWTADLLAMEVAEEHAVGPPASVPSLVPTTAADHPMGISPGSGVAEEAVSGVRSPGSWNSRSPGTAEEVTERIFRPFRPETEALDDYVSRITRQASVLSALGEAIQPEVVALMLQKARYESRVHDDAPGDAARQLRMLQREYAFENLDLDGTAEQLNRLRALEGL